MPHGINHAKNGNILRTSRHRRRRKEGPRSGPPAKGNALRGRHGRHA